jgi:hypothetical protein
MNMAIQYQKKAMGRLTSIENSEDSRASLFSSMEKISEYQ